MPQAIQSIVIQGDLEQIFDITNDIDRWPELFNEYNYAKVLSKERHGRYTKLIFELENAEGQRWQSWRLLDHQDHVAIAQRGTPMFPFKFMHLTWKYEVAPEGGVLMTWIQDFEMDPSAPVTNEQVYQRMVSHMADNQVNFKKVLESQPISK